MATKPITAKEARSRTDNTGRLDAPIKHINSRIIEDSANGYTACTVSIPPTRRVALENAFRDAGFKVSSWLDNREGCAYISLCWDENS